MDQKVEIPCENILLHIELNQNEGDDERWQDEDGIDYKPKQNSLLGCLGDDVA